MNRPFLLLKAFIASLLILGPSTANSTPIKFRVDFFVDQILQGCSSYPCGHVDGSTFSRFFTIDSDVLALPSKISVIDLSSPLTFEVIGAGILAGIFAVNDVTVHTSLGAITDFDAHLEIPVQCQLSGPFGSCFLRAGTVFDAHDGGWTDSWNVRVLSDPSDLGSVRGSYAISTVPEPGTGALISAVAFALLGVQRVRRRKQ